MLGVEITDIAFEGLNEAICQIVGTKGKVIVMKVNIHPMNLSQDLGFRSVLGTQRHVVVLFLRKRGSDLETGHQQEFPPTRIDDVGRVKEELNPLAHNLLILGMGMPLQEEWLRNNCSTDAWQANLSRLAMQFSVTL